MSHVLVVDLDGTLIRTNSFPMWLKYLLWGSVKRGHVVRATRIVWWSVLRRAHVYSHDELKRRLLDLPSSDEEVHLFAQRMTAFACPEVIARTADVAADHRILATAAPHDYVQATAVALGLTFDAVLAANTEGGVYRGMAREDKAESVMRHLSEDRRFTNADVTLFTDHRDDLPLARHASHVVLCNPDVRSRAAYDDAGVRYELITRPAAVERDARLSPYDLTDPKLFEAACDALYSEAVASFGAPEVVVGIATGGAHIAERMAEIRGEDDSLMIVKRQRASTGRKAKILGRVVRTLPTGINWQLRRIESGVRERLHRLSRQSPANTSSVISQKAVDCGDVRNVLVVDDAVDTGDTLRTVVTFVREQFPGADVRTAVLATSFAAPGFAPDLSLRQRAMLRGPWSLDA